MLIPTFLLIWFNGKRNRYVFIRPRSQTMMLDEARSGQPSVSQHPERFNWHLC